MNPQAVYQELLAFVNALMPFTNLIGAVVAVSTAIGFVAKVFRRITGGNADAPHLRNTPIQATNTAHRSRRLVNHPAIFATALVALAAEGVGFLTFSAPIIASGSTRATTANAIAIFGLVLSALAWFPSMYSALRGATLQGGFWFVGLFIIGLLLYIPAIFERDFLSYCLVGVVPAFFGVLGPRVTPHDK